MSQTPRRKGPSRPNTRRRPANERDFWGSADTDQDLVEVIRPVDEPTAMIASLGQPPLPGGETIAEHYFAVIYEKAAALAVALAASSDLLEPADEDA